MAVDNTKLVYLSQWDIDQLFDNYPKTVSVTIPAGVYPNFSTILIETLSQPLANGEVYVTEGYYKSITDSDVAWHQLGERAWIPSTGGAAKSGANVSAVLSVTNGSVQLFGSNWYSGPGGVSRDVTLSVRYCVFTDKVEY